MFRIHRLDIAADEDAARQTASLAGLAVVLLLLVIGLFLVHRLGAEGAREDCLLAGFCPLAVVLPDGAALTRQF